MRVRALASMLSPEAAFAHPCSNKALWIPAFAQWSGFGGMLGFALQSRAARDALLDRVELCKPWVSLGDAASLVHDARGENRIRMSVGLEDCADIERDLEQAIG